MEEILYPNVCGKICWLARWSNTAAMVRNVMFVMAPASCMEDAISQVAAAVQSEIAYIIPVQLVQIRVGSLRGIEFYVYYCVA